MKYLRTSAILLVFLFVSCEKNKQYSKNYKQIEQLEYLNDSILIVRKYYLNGKLKSATNFANKLKNGLQSFYFENGVLMYEGYYHNDLEDGKHSYYSESGKITQTKFFNKGVKIGEWEYYEDGVLVKKLYYLNGKFVKSEIVK